MKKLFCIVGILALVAVGAVFVLNAKFNKDIKEAVETNGSESLQTAVTLEKVNISFFTKSGQMSGLKVNNPEGYEKEYAFYMGTLDVAIGAVEEEIVHILRVSIDSPEIVFEGNPLENNLAQLQKNAKASQPEKTEEDTEVSKPEEDAKAPKIKIDLFEIKNAKVSAQVMGKDLSINLPTLTIKNIGGESGVSNAKIAQEVFAKVTEKILTELKKEMSNMPKPGDIIEKVKKIKLPPKPDFPKPPFGGN